MKRLLRRLSPPLFTLRIREGGAVLESGTATPAFVRDCGDIAASSGIRDAWIWGFRTRSGVRLDFSSGVPEGDRQRFRNLAGVHR